MFSRLAVLVAALSLAACGYSSRDSELIGQVKKVVRNTPIICSEYEDALARSGKEAA